MSALEDALASQIAALGLPAPTREHRFDPARRWRFDFAWPGCMLALEVEGGTWATSRHTTGRGYEQDCEKYNAAAIAGWRVLRVTGTMIHSGSALALLEQALAIAIVGSNNEPSGRDPLPNSTLTPTDAPGGSWIETKEIHGHLYRYRRWREHGRLRSQYLGKA